MKLTRAGDPHEIDAEVISRDGNTIRVRIGDKEIAVLCERDIGRFVECVLARIVTGSAGPAGHGLTAKDHLEPAGRIELHHSVAFYVDGPDIPVGVNSYPMRRVECILTPGLQHLPALVELNDGMRAAIEDPHIVAAIDRNAGGFAEVPAFGKLGPVLDDFVGQWGA